MSATRTAAARPARAARPAAGTYRPDSLRRLALQAAWLIAPGISVAVLLERAIPAVGVVVTGSPT